jgi:hypothetical protein
LISFFFEISSGAQLQSENMGNNSNKIQSSKTIIYKFLIGVLRNYIH